VIEAALNSESLTWEEITLQRNDFLIQAGQVEKFIYFIKEGAIRAFILTEEEDLTIRFGYKGSIMTALPSYFTAEPTEHFLQAIRKTVVLKTTKTAFEEYIQQDIILLKSYNQLLKDLVASFLEREIDLLTQSPSLRIERLLKRSPQVFQEIPQKYIASYLRMTPETLSRLLKS